MRPKKKKSLSASKRQIKSTRAPKTNVEEIENSECPDSITENNIDTEHHGHVNKRRCLVAPNKPSIETSTISTLNANGPYNRPSGSGAKILEALAVGDNPGNRENEITNAKPAKPAKPAVANVTPTISSRTVDLRASDDDLIERIPRDIDQKSLVTKYQLVSVLIGKGFRFKKKIDYLLKLLRESSIAKPDKKPLLLVLVPTGPQAQRTIAVAEHLKYCQRVDGPRLYQYNTLRSILMPLIPIKYRQPNNNNPEEKKAEESKTKATDLVDNAEVELSSDEDEQNAFQTMNSSHQRNKATTSPHGVKVRALPIMTIFLASAPVPELGQYLQ